METAPNPTNDVIDYMEELGIEPVVTIFHFAFPQALQEKFNGWTSPEMMDAFDDFADFIFAEYGSKVKYWIPVNEPSVYCGLFTMLFENRTMSTEEQELCLHHLLLGHGRVGKIYKDKYFQKQRGHIGFGAGPHFYIPASDSAEDKQAAEDANMINWGFGVTLEPMFHGRYPDQVYSSTRPTFTDAEKALLNNSVDFLAVNMYDGKVVRHGEEPPHFGVGPDTHGKVNLDSAWVMREMPKWLHQRYGGRDVGILITENGVIGGKDDYHTRGAYCSLYLRELLAGMKEYGNNILGYMVWSLIDVFEEDYTTPWGLVEVDYASGSLKRTPKESARLFQEMRRTGLVPVIEASSAAHLRPTLALAAITVLFLL